MPIRSLPPVSTSTWNRYLLKVIRNLFLNTEESFYDFRINLLLLWRGNLKKLFIWPSPTVCCSIDQDLITLCSSWSISHSYSSTFTLSSSASFHSSSVRINEFNRRKKKIRNEKMRRDAVEMNLSTVLQSISQFSLLSCRSREVPFKLPIYSSISSRKKIFMRALVIYCAKKNRNSHIKKKYMRIYENMIYWAFTKSTQFISRCDTLIIT